MSDTIVLCEKGSQAQDIRKAIGNRYGQIFAASGHLLPLEEPEDANPAFSVWGYDVLWPGGLYKNKLPDPKKDKNAGLKIKKLREIEQALKAAKTVYLATDCDREGQLIGEEILRFYKFKGRVMRAMFTAQDPKTLQDAFAKAKDNGEYINLYNAAVARQQADQVYNLSLTRAATTALRTPGSRGVVGIGRVKTPTLAIACIRELEIRNFKPVDYFEVTATCSVAAGAFQLRWAQKPDLVTDRSVAEATQAAANAWKGPLSVEVKDASQAPPKLFDLPSLQKVCGSRFGWDALRTLEIAQQCYDAGCGHITTYPRAEARYLAENQIAEVPTLLAGLAQLDAFSHLDLSSPVVRKGKKGHFSDKALEGLSHHAIIPNVAVAKDFPDLYAKLDDDQKKFFDLVSRAYVAALMPDYEYTRTTVVANVPVTGLPAPAPFRASGSIPRSLGWKAVYEDPDEEEGEAESKFPPLKDGEQAALSDAQIEQKTTQPPPRFNDGTLVAEMQDAWKYVPEGDPRRERLKEAKGIGTPATRGTIIEVLRRQGFLMKKGKHTVPTDAGLELFLLLQKVLPTLVDPGTTAQWEFYMDKVLTGALTKEKVIEALLGETGNYVEAIKGASGSTTIAVKGSAHPPSASMKKAIETIAARKNLKVPKEVMKDFGAAKAWLDANMPPRNENGSYPPSDKQIQMAQKVAASKGVDIPDGLLADAKQLSAWIDANKDALPAFAPSEKQIAFAKSVAEAAGVDIPDAALSDAKQISAFIDKHKGKMPARGAGAGSGGTSPGKIALVEKIAAEKGVKPPAGYKEDWRKAQEFLDKHMGQRKKAG